MESYLLMFLHASTNLKASHDLETIVARTLNANLLGEHVGTAWGYGKVLQWTPAVTRKDLEELQNIEQTWKRIGFNKVQGDAVVATVGGIFQQFVSICRSLVARTWTDPFPFI
jgi:Cu/Ag efflux pump CusA